MKKRIAIFLLLVYSFSAIQLSELFKISTLVSHYYETRQNDDPNIRFLHFLVMHYITDDGNSRDNDRDSQLPFKSNHSIIGSNSSNVILRRPEVVFAPTVVKSKADFHHYNTPFISSDFHKFVWNPPRFA